ncbi:ester cyclase [Paenibacillus spongiae]|uniref:ester cyclase n=1 Tax=Paenibacillus spongiae TaxID=2909671 RepID=UPI0035A22149
MLLSNHTELVRIYFDEVHNNGNFDQIGEIIHPQFVLHHAGGEEHVTLKQAIEITKRYLSSFPDMHFRIEQVIEKVDKVVAQTTFTGTHKGPMLNIPATGKSVVIQSVHIFRLENGKISEVWLYRDDLGLMRQLGVISIE